MSYKEIEAKNFKEFNKKNQIILIDVSKKDLFDSGSIPNSINVPYKLFKKNYEKYVSQDKPIYITSNSGSRAKRYAKFLSKKGYDATFIKGGSDAYGLNYPLVRKIHQVIDEKR